MKKLFLIAILVALFAIARTITAASPDGVNGPWADAVIEYNQGTNSSGGLIAPERTDPSQALGAAENNDTLNFVSLGFGGSLILEFDNFIINGEGNDIRVVETSYGSPSCNRYPEKVRVYASQTGECGTWVNLGVGCLDSEFDLGSLTWARYLKLVDETNADDFGGSADGFDVDGVEAIHSSSEKPGPTYEARGRGCVAGDYQSCFYRNRCRWQNPCGQCYLSCSWRCKWGCDEAVLQVFENDQEIRLEIPGLGFSGNWTIKKHFSFGNKEIYRAENDGNWITVVINLGSGKVRAFSKKVWFRGYLDP